MFRNRRNAAGASNEAPLGSEGASSNEPFGEVPCPSAAMPSASESFWIPAAFSPGLGAPSSAVAEPMDRQVLQLIEEMTTAWRDGRRPRAEDYLAIYPELSENTDVALRVIEHEVRLLRKVGLEVSCAELSDRFPQWSDRVRVLADPTSVCSHTASAPSQPAVGGVLGDYLLRAILGRGARGMVYLAEQLSLANRPVVLKVTPRIGSEHLSLARLQHANIVPIYGVQELKDQDFRLLCMPYLGGATLAHILSMVRDIPVGHRTGLDILRGIDEVQAESPHAIPPVGPARQLLARLSYVRAVCWLGASLADALQFAHQRELLHLDIKPSNVLIAADGTPMLLDFHLAQAPLQAGEKVMQRLGGTSAYMPAEQWAAMLQAREGKLIPSSVDGRADIYALGVLLYEALGGAIPAGFCPTLALQFKRPAHIPPGLVDIVAKCLAFEPEQRYANAALLADDLRRQFADLPLRGVPNRSLAERWGKWRRRRPHALGHAAVLMTVGLGLCAGVFVAFADARQRVESADKLLVESRGLLDRREYRAATRVLERGLSIVTPHRSMSPFSHLTRARRLQGEFTTALRSARRALFAEDLHEKLDQLRILHGADLPPSQSLNTLEHQLRAAWDARGTLADYLKDGAAPDQAERLRADALDLAVLWSDLGVRLASPGGSDARRRQALQTLTQAEKLFGPSPVLERERERYAESLGESEVARAAALRARALVPTSAWEHYALGRSFLDAGALDAAASEFEHATEMEPRDLWGHFYQGICAYRMHRFEQASHAFDICVALADDKAECYYNRARAETAAGNHEDALRDYDHALRLDPRMGFAALNRGVILYGAKRYKEAIANFERALEIGADPILAHYNLALAYHAEGARDAARESLANVLRIDPRHKEARRLERLWGRAD